MKTWQGHHQLFPIALAVLLAGLSFWLQSATEIEETKHDGKLRHDPDAMAEDFSVRSFEAGGRLKYRLTGPYLEHYPDDDSSELRSPVLVLYRPDSPPLTFSSDHARVTSGAETVFLWDNVVVLRDPTANRPAMRARMPELTAQPDLGTAFTSSPVEITQGPSQLNGVGATLDSNTSVFVLQSQVTGTYISTARKP